MGGQGQIEEQLIKAVLKRLFEQQLSISSLLEWRDPSQHRGSPGGFSGRGGLQSIRAQQVP